jgi:hypothetical protein
MNIASLSEYAKHKDGTYVSMEMSQHSREMLDNFVLMNLGLSERVDPNSYHTTVIYSRTPVPTAEHLPRDWTAIATALGYEVFPTKNDGKCLVLRVHCQTAEALNAQLTREGATSDYPVYKSHVTLAYDIQYEVDPHTLPVPKFELTFDKLNVSPLEADYIPPNAK